jgi:4-hydroxy-2-oxoheptanedioate aldolase
LKHILATCRKHGVPAGIHCGSPEEARHRIEEGWQFIAIASELRMMLDGVNSALERLGRRQQGEMAKY